MSTNLYCVQKSGERRALGVVVELGLKDMVDIVGVGGDAVIENVKVDASVTPWLDLGTEEEKGKDGEKDCESKKEEYKC
ncbi:hypothetical protein AHAS_Ahas03G0210600 [Arachis hypogaea]